MILSIRADESIHRDLNHRFSELAKDADVEEEIVNYISHDQRIFHEEELTNKN